jgi:hypothetical protein
MITIIFIFIARKRLNKDEKWRKSKRCMKGILASIVVLVICLFIQVQQYNKEMLYQCYETYHILSNEEENISEDEKDNHIKVIEKEKKELEKYLYYGAYEIEFDLYDIIRNIWKEGHRLVKVNFAL